MIFNTKSMDENGKVMPKLVKSSTNLLNKFQIITKLLQRLHEI